MKNSPPIRVFFVEDSPVTLTIFKQILASSTGADLSESKSLKK